MDFEVLRRALRDQSVSEQATEGARTAAVSARQETRATIDRMNDQVRLEVAKSDRPDDSKD